MYWATESQREVVLRLAGGEDSINPGALSVTQKLQYFSQWFEMLCWLDRKGCHGERLWMLYKDRFNQSLFDLGDFIKQGMREEGKVK